MQKAGSASDKATQEQALINKMLKETGWDKEPLDFSKAPQLIESQEEFFEELYYERKCKLWWHKNLKSLVFAPPATKTFYLRRERTERRRATRRNIFY
eukprot:g80315.t1